MEKCDSIGKLLNDNVISQRTHDAVKIGKSLIERKYKSIYKKIKMWNKISTNLNKFNLTDEEKSKIKHEIYSKEIKKYFKRFQKKTIRDYEPITLIGSGAFGEVYICREIKTKKIVAVKKMKKTVIINNNQIAHTRNEQLFLSKVKSKWIVKLIASFQDNEYLYLIMEYLPGGDLMNLLIEKDIFTEDEAKFYMVELILAIEEIHKLDCIHRDIKPDNILIDKNGHIKLSDFGLAKISDKIFQIKINNNEKVNYLSDITDSEKSIISNKHEKNYSCVGTAYYVAPEVLEKNGYGPEVDWWSAGVIFFEMLIGYAPFCSEDTNKACYKVVNFKKYLKIPSQSNISNEAIDLIFKLVNNAEIRLGINGVDEIKKHPFFNGVDWENIINSKAPFIPELESEFDSKYFSKFEEKEPFYPENYNYIRKDVEFMDYSYNEGDSDIYSNNILEVYKNAIKKTNLEDKLKNFSVCNTTRNKSSRNSMSNTYNNIHINTTYDIYNKNRVSMFNRTNGGEFINKKLFFNKLNITYSKKSTLYNKKTENTPMIKLYSQNKKLKINKNLKKLLSKNNNPRKNNKINDKMNFKNLNKNQKGKSPDSDDNSVFLQKLIINNACKRTNFFKEKVNYSYFNTSNFNKDKIFQNTSRNNINNIINDKSKANSIDNYNHSGNNKIVLNIKQIFTQQYPKLNRLYKKKLKTIKFNFLCSSK